MYVCSSRFFRTISRFSKVNLGGGDGHKLEAPLEERRKTSNKGPMAAATASTSFPLTAHHHAHAFFSSSCCWRFFHACPFRLQTRTPPLETSRQGTRRAAQACEGEGWAGKKLPPRKRYARRHDGKEPSTSRE